MESFFENRKLERLNAIIDENALLSRHMYNFVMGAVVLYGLMVNAYLCRVMPNVYEIVNPVVFLVIYMVLVMGGVALSSHSTNPIISFVGYNMVVIPFGMLVSVLVNSYGGVDSVLVRQVFTFTALITTIMLLVSTVFPDFFLSIGKGLFVSLIAIVIGGLVGFFIMGINNIVSLFATVVFSLYIGYDFSKSQIYSPTLDNAIDCALDIYLDIINLFIRLLSILGKGRKRK